MAKSILMTAVFDITKRKGGVIHFIEIAENLMLLGNKITVVLPGYQKAELYNDIFSKNIEMKIIKLHFKSKIIAYVEFEVRMFFWNLVNLKKINFDIFYQRTTLLNILSGVISLCRRIPYVLEVNGLIKEELKHQSVIAAFAYVIENFHKVNLKISSHIITVTNGIRTILIERYGLNGENISVIENGANHLKFRRVEYSNRVASLLNIDNKSLTVGYVGVFASWHGINELKDAMIATKNRNIKFLLIGDGPLFEAFKFWVGENNIKNVILTGYIENSIIHEYISIFDYCYVGITKKPIDGGVSPLKFYEYIACGKNVICSDVPDINNIVETNRLGYLFSDVDGLIEILDNLVKPGYTNLATPDKVRNLFVDKYSWVNAAKKTNDIFCKL